MGGVDTVRGITFQTAWALLTAIKVAADPAASILVVEGEQEIVDYEVWNQDGRCAERVQVRSRLEPRSWTRIDVVALIQQWLQDGWEEVDQFAFVSDAPLGPSAHEVANQVRDLVANRISPAGRDTLEAAGLGNVPIDLLKRIDFRTRSGDAMSILAKASRELMLIIPGATSEVIDAKINALFVELSIAGGSPSIARRRFSRDRLARLLDIDSARLSDTQTWDDSIAKAYREIVASRGSLGESRRSSPKFELLNIDQIQCVPSSGERPETETLEALFGRLQSFSISSTTGGGKTTSLRAIDRLALQEGMIPVYLSPKFYEPGTLEIRIGQVLERALQVRLSAAAIDRFLDDERAILLIDGVTERPSVECNELLADLVRLHDRKPQLRLIATGRDASTLARLDCPLFLLSGLTAQNRLQLVSSSADLNHDERMRCERIEQRLGTAASVPLLFRLALTQAKEGTIPATRGELYEAFIRRLHTPRAEQPDIDLVSAVLARCALGLHNYGRHSAPRIWWLQSFHEALQDLARSEFLSVRGVAAGELFDATRRIGLLLEDFEGLISFVHDSFCDYFVGQALLHGVIPVPESIDSDWEDATCFLAELGGASSDVVNVVARSNLVVLARLAALSEERPDSVGSPGFADLVATIVSRHLSRVVLKDLGLEPLGVVAYAGDEGFIVALGNDGSVQDCGSTEDYQSSVESARMILHERICESYTSGRKRLAVLVSSSP